MLPLLAAAVSLFLTGCEGKLVEQVDLIPQAQSVTIKNGSFSLADLRTMQAPAEWTENAQTFAGLLRADASPCRPRTHRESAMRWQPSISLS